MNRMLYFSNEFWEKLKTKAKELEMKPSQYIRYILIKYWNKEIK